MQSLKGILPDKAVAVIQELASGLSDLTGKFTTFAKQPFVTKPQADASYGPAATSKALQVNGPNPLNVTGLIGVLSQPQLAKAPASKSAPATGPTAQPGTLVTINNIISQVISPGNASPLSAIANILSDTRANRIANYPPANYPPGTPFFESDSTLIYIVQVVSSVNKWVYIAGTYARTQSQLSTLAGTLSATDTGLLVNVTDYAHILQWTGSAWNWGPGEDGSGYFGDFAVAPTGVGWHACDGSTGVPYLKHDGTLGTLTVPNTASSFAYRKSSSAYASAITAAVNPGGSSTTGTSTTGITVSGAAAASAGSGSVNNGAGASQAVLTPPFSGGGGGGAVTDPGHNHTIGAITLPGDPVANYSAITYFRQ